MLAAAAYWVWETITNWARLPVPYKWVALYYYGLIALPLKGFAVVWNYLLPSGSLDGRVVLAMMGVFAYGFALLVALLIAAQLLRRKLLYIVFGPLALMLLWMAGQSAWGWMTKG